MILPWFRKVSGWPRVYGLVQQSDGANVGCLGAYVGLLKLQFDLEGAYVAFLFILKRGPWCICGNTEDLKVHMWDYKRICGITNPSPRADPRVWQWPWRGL